MSIAVCGIPRVLSWCYYWIFALRLPLTGFVCSTWLITLSMTLCCFLIRFGFTLPLCVTLWNSPPSKNKWHSLKFHFLSVSLWTQTKNKCLWLYFDLFPNISCIHYIDFNVAKVSHVCTSCQSEPRVHILILNHLPRVRSSNLLPMILAYGTKTF